MNERSEIRARHVAGHAYGAIEAKLSVFRLTIDEFDEDVFVECRGKHWLDQWTVIERPEARLPAGTSRHTMYMDTLAIVALSGPAAELSYRGEPCTVESMQQFPRDWETASEIFSFIWPDDDFRAHQVERFMERAAVFVSHRNTVEKIEAIAEQLISQRTIYADEVQTTWDQVVAKQEARARRPISKWLLEDDDEDSFFGRLGQDEM